LLAFQLAVTVAAAAGGSLCGYNAFYLRWKMPPAVVDAIEHTSLLWNRSTDALVIAGGIKAEAGLK